MSDQSALYTAEQIEQAMHGEGIEQFRIEKVIERLEA